MASSPYILKLDFYIYYSDKTNTDVLRTRPPVAPVKAPAAPLIAILSRGVAIGKLGYHVGASFSIELLNAINANKHNESSN